MIYLHEYRERRNNGDIKHIVMPSPVAQYERAMYEYLDARELDYNLARSNGWYASITRGPRIIIPCINTAGFNYWQARSMTNHPIRYDSPPIPRKDSIVFLWAVGKKDTIVITEGPCDALAAAEWFPAIAIMGGSPSEEVMEHIRRKVRELGFRRVVLVPDRDNMEFLDKFMEFREDATLHVALPRAKDLAAMPRWEREKLFNTL